MNEEQGLNLSFNSLTKFSKCEKNLLATMKSLLAKI